MNSDVKFLDAARVDTSWPPYATACYRRRHRCRFRAKTVA